VSRSIRIWLASATPFQGLISVLKDSRFSAIIVFDLSSRSFTMWRHSRVGFSFLENEVNTLEIVKQFVLLKDSNDFISFYRVISVC
jgi:hypothetical protein